MPSSAESGSVKDRAESEVLKKSAKGEAPILITMGEPAGIGPEVAMAAFDHFGGKIGAHPLKLVGDTAVFARHKDAVIATTARAARSPGKPDGANAAAVTQAIEIAVKACLNGEAAAIVTAPINKAVLNGTGFAFPGHTEFLAYLTGARRAVMMLASNTLRVVPLTIHLPIADVPKAVDKLAVFETAEIIERYRDIVNFDFWRACCEAEVTEPALRAREAAWSAAKEFGNARLQPAKTASWVMKTRR